MPSKAAKPKIPDIPWGDDNDQLVWAFITECEKVVNYKVLFGKKETAEVCQIVWIVLNLIIIAKKIN